MKVETENDFEGAYQYGSHLAHLSVLRCKRPFLPHSPPSLVWILDKVKYPPLSILKRASHNGLTWGSSLIFTAGVGWRVFGTGPLKQPQRHRP